MRVARPIELTEDQRATLERWSHGRSTPVRMMERATMVLRAAQGINSGDINLISPSLTASYCAPRRWLNLNKVYVPGTQTSHSAVH